MSEKKVAHEVAVSDFERFRMAFDLDDEADLDDADKAIYQSLKSTIVVAIERGKVVVDDDGCPSMFVESKKAFVKFREPMARDLMGGYATAHGEVAKSCAALASLTGCDASTFSGMAMRDFTVAKALFQLFM